ncbi:DUF3562 domain-containing protein [Cupriavidus necator]
MRTEDQDHVVARIAMETGFPLEVVREFYLAAFRDLSADARVHAYLPLFAAKRAIAQLRSADSESGTQTRSLDPDAERDAPQAALSTEAQDLRIRASWTRQPTAIASPIIG